MCYIDSFMVPISPYFICFFLSIASFSTLSMLQAILCFISHTSSLPAAHLDLLSVLQPFHISIWIGDFNH